MRLVCVLGCGVMGSGIAQVCAQKGYEVHFLEKNKDLVDKGLSSIRDSVHTHLVKKGKMSEEEAERALSRIRGTVDMAEAVPGADIIIEAVPEDLDLKRRIFATAEKYSREETIFASNTSSLMISEIAANVKRKDRVIGMHWFYPPQVMKLIEIVRGMLTSDETYNLVKEFSVRLGKVPVTSKDSPGFVVVRLISGFLADAVRCAEEGLMSIEEIDKACRLGLNHPMGPFELLDHIGLDTYLEIYEYMFRATGDPRYRSPITLRRMVSSGYLGRKVGKGFYDYNLK
ncbi:3-hydroxyacyl-CoA dehydrogenase family protein [Candidatus Bathyarchaeota archaeon]|nr:3-hydroxyacyl-CoA dehydrogenase family protein [Candidatus Bathyarchaeota archaeon]MBS7629624.1 3-hydroxyacyl-CoA dehydrogenase family protein [Candidatus Bathyarchaeota archaeon]